MPIKNKRALISGITGQDGSYLAELLLDKGYEVHGIVRRTSNCNTQRIEHIYKNLDNPDSRLILHHGDLTDSNSLQKIIHFVKPIEIYNLAAQSHVKCSFDQPVYTADVVAMGALRLLDAVREYIQRSDHLVKVYQACSSEMFGISPSPQSEITPFHPRSPYAVAKVSAYWHAINYKEAYGIFICNGILFNHESPRRGESFVTRKISRALGRILVGLQDKLILGNIDAKRDWGFAPEYVNAMWLMLQQEKPDDFVIATGISHSVKEFLDTAFSYKGLDWKNYVEINSKHFRPSEVEDLVGDHGKAKRILGWNPQVTFKELVHMMVDFDLDLARQEKKIKTD